MLDIFSLELGCFVVQFLQLCCFTYELTLFISW